jgi:hypothetical protein
MQVSRAATLDTASNATAITVSRLVDKREQFFGNPPYRPSFPTVLPGTDLVLLSRKIHRIIGTRLWNSGRSSSPQTAFEVCRLVRLSGR